MAAVEDIDFSDPLWEVSTPSGRDEFEYDDIGGDQEEYANDIDGDHDDVDIMAAVEDIDFSDPLWEVSTPSGRGEHGGANVVKSIFTTMEAVVMLVYICTRWALPRECRRALFQVIGLLLPRGNNMPKHTEIEHRLRSREVCYRRVKTCPNNCCVASKMTLKEFDELLTYAPQMPSSMRNDFLKYFQHAVVPNERKTCPHCVSPLEKEFLEVNLRKKIQSLYKDPTFAKQVHINFLISTTKCVYYIYDY